MDHASPKFRVQAPLAGEWEKHKETIVDLYIGQRMSLPRLMEYMHTQHNFRATEKMYKSRLKKWGAVKNIKAEQVKTWIAHKPTSVEGNPPLDVKRINTYMSRLPEKKRMQLLRSIPEPMAATLSQECVASSHLLVPTNDMQPIERCILLLQGYVKGSSEGNLWPRDPVSGFLDEDVVPAWCSPVFSASQVISVGKVNEANRFLQQFIRQFPKQLVRQDPLIFAFIYTSVLFFARKNPEVAKYLLSEFQNAFKHLQFPPLHPLRLLIDVLVELGPKDMLAHATKVLLTYVDIIHKTLGEAYPIVQDLMADAMARLRTYDEENIDSMADLAQRTLEEAERQNRDKTKFNLRLKLRLAVFYLLLGKYDSAREVAMNIMAPSNDDIRDGDITLEYQMTMCKINDAQGLQEDAILFALRSLVTSIEVFGRWSDWTVHNLINYRRILEKYGKISEAELVERDTDQVIEGLIDKVEKLDLSAKDDVETSPPVKG